MFAALLDACPIASLVCEGARVTYANSAARKLWHDAPEAALVGSWLTDLLPDDIVTVLLRPDAAGGLFPAQARHPDGRLVEVLASVSARLDSAGRIAVYLQPASQLASLALSHVINAAPVGLLVLDPEGRIELTNKELERQFEYLPGELLGKPVEVLLPERDRPQHPALRQSYLKSPSPRRMGGARELNGRTKSGGELAVEIGLTPLATPGGDRVVASVSDVSERIRLENNFKQAFEAAPCGMLIIDEQGLIQSANNKLAHIFGHERSALVGADLSVLIPKRHRAAHAGHLRAYERDRRERDMGPGRDLTGLHADGTELTVEIGLSPLQMSTGPGVLGLVVDISERARVESELRTANAHLEEFTYVASHDLRSPLRGISDLVEWIGEDLGEQVSPEVNKNLERVRVRVRRMETLIEDLLAYARAGQTSIQVVDVDLAELIDGLLEVQPLPETFELQTQLDLPTLQTAKTPLETVLRNLLSNAVKHHDRQSGTLKISSRAQGSYCVITVSDDGPGIPSASRERVFKLFQTVTSKERGGSGIGLSLSKRLVECHGGRIAITSPPDQRGTTFEISLPRFYRRDVHATDNPERAAHRRR